MAYAKQGLFSVTRARNCASCGDVHYDRFKWCAVCRVTSALRLAIWRTGQRARKLCTSCVQGAHYSRSAKRYFWNCDEHHALNNARMADRYHERRARGVCTQCGRNRTSQSVCGGCK